LFIFNNVIVVAGVVCFALKQYAVKPDDTIIAVMIMIFFM